MFNVNVIFFIVLFALASCATRDEPTLVESLKEKINTEIYGWFDGDCFATLEKNLSPETEILVVLLDDPPSISLAKIIGPANLQTCGPLSNDRREQNEADGLSFYEVESQKELGLAIGIIGKVSQPKIINGVVRADIGNNGITEHFTLCATNDGISFDIWVSKPYEKSRIWSGFYYLGYDVERTCP